MRYLTMLAIGLATLSTNGSAQQAQPPTRLPVTRVIGDTMKLVTVQNDRSTPVTVYLESAGFDRRLGVVAAGEVATLPLPAWAVNGRRTLRLLARPEGSGVSVATPFFAVSGVVRVGLLVPPSGIASIDSVPVPLTAEERASTTITIDNPRNKPMTVFAEQGLRSVRLGEVPANTQATLSFPKDLIARGDAIRVFVRPVGGMDVATRALNLKTGDHIAVEIVF
ncbi:hypothetical protein [Gemmatimonas sp.]|jgi:hypothetical protein|uniref:hypothetical protein n=1 Tax=Gemmatimonas sp. TaxID=1962908 RepID=UPI0037BF7517